MQKARGIYDGRAIILFDPLELASNTAVEVLVSDQVTDPELVYLQRMLERGLIKEIRPIPAEEYPVTPVQVTGPPVSQTIIEERR